MTNPVESLWCSDGVVDPQGRRGVARLQRVEGVVPPVVDRQQAAARPVLPTRVEEVDALGVPTLHLVGVDDRVDGPDVTRVASPQRPRAISCARS